MTKNDNNNTFTIIIMILNLLMIKTIPWIQNHYFYTNDNNIANAIYNYNKDDEFS